MSKKSLIKINMRGGIISSGDLKSLLDILKEGEIEEVHLGERQNILFHCDRNQTKQIGEQLDNASLDYEIDADNFPNIISSYATEDIFTRHPWISEGMYRDILHSFASRPKIKINISDNTQALVPLFTGDLNFIPSSHLNFYFVYLNRHDTSGMECWNKLIYCNDIPVLSGLVEAAILRKDTFNLNSLLQGHSFISMDAGEALELPRLRFPYYEGMNKFGEKFWLGIYRRKNNFNTDLLESIYELCSETRIGQVNITPWKSILIKGIAEDERIEWEKLLSKNGINSRHSSLELNWQLPDMDVEAQRIKNDLVKDFDKLDIRTYGLTFAVHTGKNFDISSSVVIRKKEGAFKFWGFFKTLTTYDVFYAPDFNSNAAKYITFAKNVPWNALSVSLRSLSDKFYRQLSEKQIQPKEVKEEKLEAKENPYHCRHCLTVYDEKTGDPGNHIPPGTSFINLPENYVCPLCEHPKSDYVKIELELHGHFE